MGRECDWLTKRKTNIQFCVDRGHRSQTHWHFLFIDEWSNREPDIKSPMGYLLTKSRFIIWCVIWTTTMMMAPYQWKWLHSSANITTSSNTLWPTNTTYASYCSFNAIWMGNQRRRVTGSQPQNATQPTAAIVVSITHRFSSYETNQFLQHHHRKLRTIHFHFTSQRHIWCTTISFDKNM